MGCLAVMRLSVIETLRRKEFYVVLVLVFLLAVWMMSMNPGGSGAGRFAKDIVMQVIWLASFALAAPLAARQIAADLEHKSIYVIMSRPIHRWHYVFGRTGGAAAAAVVCFCSMFVVLITMLGLKGPQEFADPSMWQAFALQLAALVMLSSVSVFFSTFSTPAGSITFSIVILAAMRYGGPAILHRIESMAGAAQGIAYTGYLVLPHFEFFNMAQRVVHGWGPLPMSLFGQVLLYGLVYSLSITSLAAWIFKKRWL